MLKRCFSRKLSYLTAILLFTGLMSQAQLNPPIGQSPWAWANPSPLGSGITDMSFIDNNTGLAVGAGGCIARTTDAGVTWNQIPYKYVDPVSNTLTIANFNDVQFVTPSIAYAVGSTGLMIKSTDGGLNWTQVTTPLTKFQKSINALHFLNKDTGYIGGQAIIAGNTTNINNVPKVYFTRNGGASWDSLATPFIAQANAPTLNWNNEKEIQRIHFANDSVGYVSGSGGNNFTAGQSSLLWKIKNHTVTDYCLHRTKFGLATGTHTPSVQTYKGILMINDTTVLMSSLNNNVLIRVRTGVNDSTANALPANYGNYTPGKYEILIWLASTTTPFPANLAASVAGQMQHIKRTPDGKIAITIGNSIIFSNDLGTTWTFTKPTPTTKNYAHWGMTALDVTPNGRIFTGSFNGLIYDSLPGSSTWKTIYKNARPLLYSFNSMDWSDCNNGIIVGSSGTIVKTTDAGKTWTDVSNPVFAAAQLSLNKVIYPAVNSMYFTSYNTIYKSADQGTTNDAIFTDPNPNGALASIEMVGQDRLFAIGFRNPGTQKAVIFRSLNANAATPVWDTAKAFPINALAPNFKSIKFANKDTGYVCANRSKIYRTTDGGATWTDISYDTLTNATITYNSISVVNGKTLFVGGTSRRLLKSTDAGATWTDLTLPITTNPITITSFSSISNIEMNDATSGYLSVGNMLLKTNDAWVTWTIDLAPNSFQFISLYPKVAGPLANKKLYGSFIVAGFGPIEISTSSALLMEYSKTADFILSANTAVSNANCTTTAGATITVTATGGIPPISYSINGGPFQASNVFTGLTSGTKTIIIKDAGCQSLTRTVNVTITPSPAVSAGPDKVIVDGESITLDGSSADQLTSISWTPAATLTGANSLNPIAKPQVTTTYTLSVTNNSNCLSTDNVTVTVLPYCLKIMEAFTPNGDGMNDKWLVTQGGNCTNQILVAVYNRYGSLVYKNDNYQNDWDGTFEGKPVTDGTYYYRLTFRLVSGQVRTQKGNVTIIR